MELRNYFNVILKWWWLIVAAVVVAGMAALAGSLATPRTYLSRTTLMVGQALQNPNPSQSEFGTAQTLAQSYTDLVKREPVLRGALDALNLPWNWVVLQNMVSSRVVPGTLLVEIGVLDTDPQRAKVLADEVANQLILQSPAGMDRQREEERLFIQQQIAGLQDKIRKGEEEIRQLDDTIASATSARQIQDARSRQQQLQEQISIWQSNYAQLSVNLQSSSTNFLSVVEPAQIPTGPSGSGTTTNMLLAAVIGLVLATGAAFLLEYLDDAIKSPDEIRRLLNVPTLGSIAQIEDNDHPDKLVTVHQPRSPVAEAYRMLRTNLQFSSVDKPLRTLLITSAVPGEGKSVTAANTAVIMAQSGKQVLLVDADLRRPSVHALFQVDDKVGLTTALLEDEADLSSLLQTTDVPRLRVMATGPLPPDPSELLNSQHMTSLIESLLQEVDIVVFDTPPAVAVTDASVLAAKVDGVLLVIDCGHTRRGEARHSKEVLDAVGARVLGAVFNRAPLPHRSYTYYYTEEEVKRQRQQAGRRRRLAWQQRWLAWQQRGRSLARPSKTPAKEESAAASNVTTTPAQERTAGGQ
jgi:capsular exopolysaccharide synthesis family protein